jgi:hypothetical protein
MSYTQNEVEDIVIYALVERDKYWKSEIEKILRKNDIEDIKKTLLKLIKGAYK